MLQDFTPPEAAAQAEILPGPNVLPGEAPAANPLLEAALAHAGYGLPVFPIKPDDKDPPLVDGWPELASTHAEQVEAWWRWWPQANVGIACGGPARLLVVDVDVKKENGEASIAKLEEEHGPLPETVESITPSGGRHIWLTVPIDRPLPGNTVATETFHPLGLGVDTRCHHGYIVSPPSTVDGHPYEWSVDSGDSIATAPAWLLDKLGEARTKRRRPTAEWIKVLTEGVTEGARNTEVARLAGKLLRELNEPMIAAQLVACFNRACCYPPLPDDELARTLDSITEREMKRKGLL
jgi:hypothetical protein